MSKENTARKAEAAETPELDHKAAESNEICNGLIEKAHNGLKATKQSREQLEGLLQTAINQCLIHARTYGDVMPMDRLIKPLVTGDSYEQMLSQEIVAWLRKHSPIRWDAKKRPYQAKEDDPTYKPYVESPSEVTSFSEDSSTMAARRAARQAANRNLNPMGINELRGLVYGIRKRFDSAGKKNVNGRTRGYVEGQKPKMELLINGLEASFNRMVGEDAAETEQAVTEKLEEKNKAADKAA